MVESSATSGRLRLFVAVSVPEKVKAGIGGMQRALRGTVARGQVRWTRSEQFHLTLRFLGAVAAERVGPLVQSLRAACQGFEPQILRVGSIGFFPEQGRPRVIWVEVTEARDQLPALHRAVAAATQEFADEGPEKKFTGHITLARVKAIPRTEAEVLRRLASGRTEVGAAEWTARQVDLIRSELEPEGPRYTTLASIALQGEKRPPEPESSGT